MIILLSLFATTNLVHIMTKILQLKRKMQSIMYKIKQLICNIFNWLWKNGTEEETKNKPAPHDALFAKMDYILHEWPSLKLALNKEGNC